MASQRSPFFHHPLFHLKILFLNPSVNLPFLLSLAPSKLPSLRPNHPSLQLHCHHYQIHSFFHPAPSTCSARIFRAHRPALPLHFPLLPKPKLQSCSPRLWRTCECKCILLLCAGTVASNGWTVKHVSLHVEVPSKLLLMFADATATPLRFKNWRSPLSILHNDKRF